MVIALERQARERHAAREVAAAQALDERAMRSACGSAGRRVHNSEHAATHDDGACTRRCITNAIAYKHRQAVTTDQVIERLIAQGVIERIGDKHERFRAGRVKP